MGQLLQLILDNLYRLWPVRIIDADSHGVLFRHRGTVEQLSPGWHWFVPGYQRIEKIHVSYQQMECGLQSMETSDGQSVTFSINVGYTIADAAKMRVQYFSFDHTLSLIARGKLAEVINTSSYLDLQTKLPEITKQMLATLREEVSGSGVRVKDVRLDEFVKCRQYRLLGPQHTINQF